jgi:23S rRNA (guanine745-N1)-methyltransferase
VRPEIVASLRCPVCGRPLSAQGAGLDCPAGHHFDAAKQGYVDLVAGPVRHPGDSAAMVTARAEFLAAGHFDFLADALVRAAPGLRAGGLVVDVGAGTGYYLARLLDGYPQALGVALDVAKPALRRAARAHPRALAARADAWRALPVADGSADLLVNVFAPRNGAEFARVLRPDGDLLVVVPAAEHLGELVAALGLLRVDPAKEQRLEQSLGDWFRLVETGELVQPLRLDRDEVGTLVGMGPSAWHQQPEALAAAIGGLAEHTAATARVRLHRYRPR